MAPGADPSPPDAGVRVLVAMSGGVDSSVAAARLVRRGAEVIGLTLHLWDTADDRTVRGRCCAPEDVRDARRVADHLGIPHYVFDRRRAFADRIVEPFVDAYLAGETPSPCVACNQHVKFAELLGLADRLGARLVATGHYARVDRAGPVPRLLRGVDRAKDQSYFLHALAPETLARLRFPLGSSTKEEVRAEALATGLPGAGKGESQELCFVPEGRYDAFVEGRAGDRVRPGRIVDTLGRVVGEHAGVHRFTVGQRRNLGVALGERSYVLGVDAGDGTVRVGPAAALARASAVIRPLALAPDVSLPLRAGVVVRYRGAETPARITALGGGAARVEFDAPVRAVVAGQVAVLHDGERVLGGGPLVADAAPRPAPLGLEARP